MILVEIVKINDNLPFWVKEILRLKKEVERSKRRNKRSKKRLKGYIF
jgi:hypothetical protein